MPNIVGHCYPVGTHRLTWLTVVLLLTSAFILPQDTSTKISPLHLKAEMRKLVLRMDKRHKSPASWYFPTITGTVIGDMWGARAPPLPIYALMARCKGAAQLESGHSSSRGGSSGSGISMLMVGCRAWGYSLARASCYVPPINTYSVGFVILQSHATRASLTDCFNRVVFHQDSNTQLGLRTVRGTAQPAT